MNLSIYIERQFPGKAVSEYSRYSSLGWRVNTKANKNVLVSPHCRVLRWSRGKD